MLQLLEHSLLPRIFASNKFVFAWIYCIRVSFSFESSFPLEQIGESIRRKTEAL